MGDGVANAHYIYTSLPQVKYQYRCFLASALAGTPTIYAPSDDADAPCP